MQLLGPRGNITCQKATCVQKEGGFQMLTLLCEITQQSLGTSSALQTEVEPKPGLEG